ncbi:MAG: WG repeat-containing protein, partial [Bacteroidaceae bacterium]|nr:WG repeat-containing protein [Bacteroidaceae bacterium]
TQGEVVVPCIYDAAWPFSDGLAKVLQNDKWSIINTQGKVIVAECTRASTSWSVVEL